MFCKNCGSQIEDGKSFCSNCGASVNGTYAANKLSFTGADMVGPLFGEITQRTKQFWMYVVSAIIPVFQFILMFCGTYGMQNSDDLLAVNFAFKGFEEADTPIMLFAIFALIMFVATAVVSFLPFFKKEILPGKGLLLQQIGAIAGFVFFLIPQFFASVVEGGGISSTISTTFAGWVVGLLGLLHIGLLFLLPRLKYSK